MTLANFPQSPSTFNVAIGGDSNKPLLSDTELQQVAREELNESPEVYHRELEALREVVKNNTNLTVPDDDQFLVRFLRARKFNSEKAFQMLQRYFLMKIKCPELFECPLPSGCMAMFELNAQNMLSQRDQWGRSIYLIRVDNFDSSKVTIDDVFRANILALEQIVREPETQIAGIVVVLDMAGLSLQHAKFFTPYYAKRMVELVQETFPLRFKGFHIVNEPFYFDAVVAVLKPFLKEKYAREADMSPRSIGKTIKGVILIRLKKELESTGALTEGQYGFTEGCQTISAAINTPLDVARETIDYAWQYRRLCPIILHGSDMNSLHAFISSDILPAEYGGSAGNFDNKSWYMQLLAEEDYFKDLKTYGYKA